MHTCNCKCTSPPLSSPPFHFNPLSSHIPISLLLLSSSPVSLLTGSKDQDEPDSGPPLQEEPSSISSAALDQLVLGGMVGEGGAGVKGKVKEHAERPEMSTAITEGLKKQAEGGGR